jgi:DNA-binding response OmpR family regulator
VRPVTRTKRSEKVLIVDDDRSVAEIISLALHAFGYHTMIVERGREALGILQGSRFDAVVLDIRMPDMDGLEVLRHIRERDKNIIVMILTAIGDEETAREAIRLEANGYFMKPFNVNLLQLNLEYAFLLQQTKRDMP